MDATRLREKYGLTLSRDLRAAIARTVAWYSEHYEALKDRRKFDEGFTATRL
jgi:dTDP-D-glucose 4,6-dehydratase